MTKPKRTGSSRNFYPRPPRGGRRDKTNGQTAGQGISIHALREEGDLYFLATSAAICISIHALREEGDSKNREKIPAFIPL